MNVQVKTVPEFEKELKKLVKKYPSLKSEYLKLIESIEKDPEQGTPLFKNCYKIRIAIKSKGKLFIYEGVVANYTWCLFRRCWASVSGAYWATDSGNHWATFQVQ